MCRGLYIPAAPTNRPICRGGLYFVGAAGLVGLEHTHCRGTSIPSRPYKKNKSLPQTFSVVMPVSTKCDIIQLTKSCNQEVDMVANSALLIDRSGALQLLIDLTSTWMFTLNTLHDVQEFNYRRDCFSILVKY